jgi:hypothetical protein
MGGQPIQPPCTLPVVLTGIPSGVALLQPAAVGVTAPLRLRKATAAATRRSAGHPFEPLAAMQLTSLGIRLWANPLHESLCREG